MHERKTEIESTFQSLAIIHQKIYLHPLPKATNATTIDIAPPPHNGRKPKARYIKNHITFSFNSAPLYSVLLVSILHTVQNAVQLLSPHSP